MKASKRRGKARVHIFLPDYFYPYKKRLCVYERLLNYLIIPSNKRYLPFPPGRKICIKKMKISPAFVYVVAFALTTVAAQREIIAMLALFG